jgi:hypothetical protein
MNNLSGYYFKTGLCPKEGIRTEKEFVGKIIIND